MLNTFFFGYLKLKWRRLIRTIVIIGLILFLLEKTDLGNCIFDDIPFRLGCFRPSNYYDYFGSNFLILIFVSLISWILKPFFVKEKE